ncbi:hypothetical protein [Pseudescherichia vulneris]|uniref:hypothetical protein n=1 Tax=Pseudescherichia vulneris TaxID=566 RepID=UPI0028D326E6|nr:hypothetical protein [Pseudescherichia vulneris]
MALFCWGVIAFFQIAKFLSGEYSLPEIMFPLRVFNFFDDGMYLLDIEQQRSGCSPTSLLLMVTLLTPAFAGMYLTFFDGFVYV